MEEKIGKAGLRDAAIGTGVAIDKICQLTEKADPSTNIAIISMPSPEERRAIHDRLDAIARRLAQRETPECD